VEHVRSKLDVSEQRVCRVIGQPRSPQRRPDLVPDEEEYLRAEIVRLAGRYGRYGYRMITGLLQGEGFRVNHKRVERIWREEGLKVPRRQWKRGRLWLNDGSCVRFRPTHRNHVWSYDFVAAGPMTGVPSGS
jgi:transposase InsO family protein